MFTVAILQDASTKDVMQSGKNTVLGSSATAVTELSIHDNITIYPNPAAETISIQMDTKVSFSYEIVDMMGKKIIHGKTEINTPISISSLHNGVYAIQVLCSERSFTKVFCIQK